MFFFFLENIGRRLLTEDPPSSLCNVKIRLGIKNEKGQNLFALLYFFFLSNQTNLIMIQLSFGA